MKIPFIEFSNRIAAVFPDIRLQLIPTASYVHVFNAGFLQEEFWPKWQGIVRAINAALPSRPLENNLKRGICDEITGRFKSEMALSSRQTYVDEDVGPGMREVSVMLPAGYSLNLVPGYGLHRTAIVAVTRDGLNWEPRFAEPQLTYAQYETTALSDAAAAGVVPVECWV